MDVIGLIICCLRTVRFPRAALVAENPALGYASAVPRGSEDDFDRDR